MGQLLLEQRGPQVLVIMVALEELHQLFTLMLQEFKLVVETVEIEITQHPQVHWSDQVRQFLEVLHL